jgi:hypothetical protein
LSGLAIRVIYRKASQRFSSLTEEEVLKWRAGEWAIAEEVIWRYRDRLIANRSLILSLMDRVKTDEISEEMARRRPDLAKYWHDEVFSMRLNEEKAVLKRFLELPAPNADPGDRTR